MINSSLSSQDVQVFTVSELSHMTSELLSECFGDIWLTGEICNLSIPASGHAYLTLKDEGAQLRVVIFKGVYPTMRSLTNGMMITLWGEMKIYTQRGELQVVARQVMSQGDGPLAIRFLQLKNYCAKQGWFSAEHKKQLPKSIDKIGVVTSLTAAALFDVLHVLERRNPRLEVVVYPSQVQGELAPKQLIQALNNAQDHDYVDVILLTRGGGSAEDLFCFNDVDLVKAIYDCKLPIVCAVGHEVDTTLADWACDVRAATPSVGAEILSEDLSQIQETLQRMAAQASQWMHMKIKNYGHRLALMKQSCQSPALKIKQQQLFLTTMEARLHQSIKVKLRMKLAKLESLKNNVEALNPLSILERGYAMVTDEQLQQVIKSAGSLTAHQKLKIRFAHDYASVAVIE
jgi:exodeoxyribonuclease VII large subunit